MVVAFDVTNEQSFKDLQRWIYSIEEHADASICKVMCANKIDLEDQRKISQKEGKELAKKYGIAYYEASAKMGKGINECFEALLE